MPDEAPLYEVIGGTPAIEVVVDDFYARVLADPLLEPFFAGINMPRLKGRQVEFFTMALGGPPVYTGRPMAEVHAGRGIESRHFAAVAGHLSDSLLAAGVPPEITEQIIGAVATLEGDIVSGATMGT